jgi:hypothetical protein
VLLFFVLLLVAVGAVIMRVVGPGRITHRASFEAASIAGKRWLYLIA